MSAGPVYDEIGVGYRRFRHADPRLASMIDAALGNARTVVDVGAGAGSYEPTDRAVVAVEPSAVMVRQRAAGAAPCLRATAEALPFRDRHLDAAMAVLTVHHWPDPVRGLRELVRVAGRVVVLTFEPAIHNAFWLWRDYVPAAALVAGNQGPTVAAVADLVGADRVEPVPIPHDCADGFGWAYWRRPDAYLDPAVRACISCLAQLPSEAVRPGIERLRHDLETGRWAERHGKLLGLDEIDGGFRLVVREPR